MTLKCDCIVIGAGPAGLTAGLELARAGIDVMILERGEYPGSKNMFGGVLYCRTLHGLIPDFWEEAPVERPVVKWVIGSLTEKSSFSMDYTSAVFCEAPYNAFTVLRSRFDRWFAQKVEAAGATLLTETVADDLLWDNDRVVGVKTGRGDLFAKVVIAADGVNSIAARKSKVRKDLISEDVSLGVKEILALPKDKINQMFSLTGNEGAACTFIGASTAGIPGGGFIYTNTDSISIGIVTKLSDLAKTRQRPEDLISTFKKHPLIEPLVKGGELREYLAHLIVESGRNRGPLYYGGLLLAGDAAGFTLNTGFRVEGANYAMMSGLAAAETVKIALQRKSYSSKGLSIYPEILRRHGVLADLEKFRHAPHFLKNPRLYQVYPEIASRFAESLFSVEPGPKAGIGSLLKSAVGNRVSWLEMIKDTYKGWRGLS